MDKRLKSHFHWPLFWCVVALLVIGLINLHSATYDLVRGGISGLVWTQALWIVIGLGLGTVLLLIDYRDLMRSSDGLYGFAMALLLLVAWFGKTVGGNRSWLELGPISFQPSEFAKLALILALARFLAVHPPFRNAYRLLDLIRPGLMILIPLVLIVIGRDMGSVLFFAVTSASILAFAGVDRRAVVLILLVALVGGGV